MADKSVDVIVIGSGIAGLMTAHLLADHLNVMVITKSDVQNSNSSWAQGGMAAAIGPKDHWQKHLEDTIRAGQHHHNYEHLKLLVKKAPQIVHALSRLGVSFDRNEDGSLVLGMEGAHQQRRIVHVNGDQTGEAFTKVLLRAVQQRATVLQHSPVYELINHKDKVIGVKTNKQVIHAKATVLATGGLGQLYQSTSNVKEATGDGFALAYRAGAVLTDMEFIQFHPTLLTKDGVSFGLISEAVRGEGAKLIDEDGNRLMKEHPLKDLASRDVVSREIHRKLQGGTKVFLDCRELNHFDQKFPGLSKRCELAGITPKESPLPIAPGAHFISGGVQTDVNAQTTIKGLYAVGEVACTGVHGANRLASNSLLEGLVFANQAANHILLQESASEPRVDTQSMVIKRFSIHCHLPNKEEIQSRMTKWVGIERSAKGLKEMRRWLQPFLFAARHVRDDDTYAEIECKNMLLTAAVITESALKRLESRGGHYRVDYSERDDRHWLGRHIICSKSRGFVTEFEPMPEQIAIESR
ncbi:L-aspartate oxidase [Halalkalibacter krulwichiae]|uniref:L-aspartate oxidase n=1 Tax=Halalkalibacter krulwichiae TaxID=199441 RepID=A0A1X9M703_9BACI|nr:L-aspartate oxidase [Halalkalibacter krulwichiae]ARK29199.1 L-aspartate oxidase [Halalkalibacter krulwichiae]